MSPALTQPFYDSLLLMDKAEFDKFADEYRSLHAANIAISGEGPNYFAEYKIKDLAAEYSIHIPSCKVSITSFL